MDEMSLEEALAEGITMPGRRRRRKGKGPEASAQSSILQWLALKRCLAVRINSGAVKVGNRFVRFNSEDGTSDILACVPFEGRGLFVAIETKAGRNKPTDNQEHFMERVRGAAGIAFAAWSIDDVRAHLPWLGD